MLITRDSTSEPPIFHLGLLTATVRKFNKILIEISFPFLVNKSLILRPF